MLVDGTAALAPLGGGPGDEMCGYKGYGYAAVVEILSAALAGGQFMKAPGYDRIYTAGEKEYLTWLDRKDEGVPIGKAVQEELITLRDKLKLNYRFSFEALLEYIANRIMGFFYFTLGQMRDIILCRIFSCIVITRHLADYSHDLRLCRDIFVVVVNFYLGIILFFFPMYDWIINYTQGGKYVRKRKGEYCF